MSDMQVKLGRALLKSLVDLRQQKGDIVLEDVGHMFMQMAASLSPTTSTTDQFLHSEIAKLAEYITSAKKEIFSISVNEKAEDAITNASQHLDEVIKATEQATNSIMDAADTIQNNVGGIGGEKEKIIGDAAIKIYDACTFQDISGQRITKVIKLLANIEERVSKLNELFGETGNGAAVAAKPAAALTDKDLLNGPQLAAQASSQSDIDALFNNLAAKG